MGVALVDPGERLTFQELRPRGGQQERFWSFCQLKYLLSRINTSNTKGLTFLHVCESSPELEAAYGVSKGKPANYSVAATTDRNTAAWDNILGDSWDRIGDGRLIINQMVFSLVGGGWSHQIKVQVRTTFGDFARRSVADYRQWVRCNLVSNNSAADRRLANTFLDEV
jgi:hypothetical protein